VVEKPKVVVPQRVEPKPVLKPITKGPKVEQLPELALAFVSTNSQKPETGDLDLLFVNNSNYHLLINVAAKENEEWFSLFHGEVLPHSDEPVQSLRRQDVGSVGNLNVDVVFFGTMGYESRKPISCSLKIKATRFVKTGNYLLYEGIENPAIAIPIENEKVVVAPASRPSRTLKPVQKPTVPGNEPEIDLHLEKLHDADMAANNHEKLLLQIRHFEWHLAQAITQKHLYITFIHGIGKERLKAEIRARLDEMELHYSDGPNFNVGSTVVFLT
jgi:hypothetical protein